MKTNEELAATVGNEKSNTSTTEAYDADRGKYEGTKPSVSPSAPVKGTAPFTIKGA